MTGLVRWLPGLTVALGVRRNTVKYEREHIGGFPQFSHCGRDLTCWAVEKPGLGLGKVLNPGENRKRLVLLISAELGAESQAAQSSEISMAEASRMVRASRHSTLRNLA